VAHPGPGLSAVRTARAAGLVACRHCASVWPEGQAQCGLCGAPLHSRDHHSLQRVWAWWLAGLIAYVPANMFPMMHTAMLGADTGSTIMGGVIELVHHGAAFVALVVLVASVLIPSAKFAAIAWIALLLGRRRRYDAKRIHRLHVLHAVVEFIGRWSMIDVFVVAILSALVQISVVVTIHPGIAAISFALSVGCTMISAQSLDPRLIYDVAREERR